LETLFSLRFIIQILRKKKSLWFKGEGKDGNMI
jgi:hypothetical protein